MTEYVGYQPIMDAVERETGCNAGFWDTGGNCVAIGVELFNRTAEILITDADDTLRTWAAREEAKANGYITGYLVGMYVDTDSGNDPVCYVRGRNTASPEGVAALVRRALDEAERREYRPSADGVDPVVELDIA